MPAAVLQSSRGRDWHGVEVMLARIAGQSLDVEGLPTHTIAINTGRPFVLEARVDGRRIREPMATGGIKIVEAGPRSRWHWERGDPLDMLHVSVSAAGLLAHARELELRSEPEIITRIGFADEQLLRLGRALAAELRGNAAHSLAADALRIELLLRLLARHSSVATTSALRLPAQRLALSALRRLDEYVDAKLGDDIGITDLAALVGVSRFHFARMFKATVGTTPYRYVLERRIDRARVLLGSAQSIGKIAAAVGFADQSHLTRHFKRRFGITPRAQRVSAARIF